VCSVCSLWHPEQNQNGTTRRVGARCEQPSPPLVPAACRASYPGTPSTTVIRRRDSPSTIVAASRTLPAYARERPAARATHLVEERWKF
jgi:hypothetical protein